MTERVALFLAVVVAGVVTMFVPMLRLRRMTGESGMVAHRSKSRAARLVGMAIGLAFTGLLAWATAFLVLGPEGTGTWRAPAALRAVAVVLVLAGFAVVVVAQAQMGASWRMGIDERATPLVTRGLFAWVRNPIFSGMLLMIAGIVLVEPAPAPIALLLALAAAVRAQVALEERHLLSIHGEAYRAYAARVGRFVPGVGRIAGRGADPIDS